MKSKRSSLGVAFVALYVFFAGAAVASAADTADPTKIGDNVKGILEPNAKAGWWILLVGGLLFMAATRKAGRAAGTAIFLVASGVAIWNPLGVVSLMQGFADRVI